MNNRVVTLAVCVLGFSLLGHFACTAESRDYDALDGSANGGNAGTGGSGAGTAGKGGTAGSSAGTSAGGTSAGGSSASGAGGESGATGGEAGSGPVVCANDNDPCDADGLSGLCFNGTCSTCIDVTDDANCKSAYGVGHLCLQGNCTAGNCRVNTDCTQQQPCLNNTCSKCKADPDCGDATKVCNTGTGACVAKTQCGGVASFGVCPVNPADHCCPGGCADVQCCVDADCMDTTKACNNGQCQLKICGAPTNGDLYVSPTAAESGTGSSTCPLKTLIAAFNYVKATPGTYKIHISGAITGTTEAAMGGAFPYMLPAGVSLVGSGVATASITTPVGLGGFLIGDGGTHSISSLTLQQQGFVATPPAVQPSGNALHPTNGSKLSIDTVLIQGFNSGIDVDTGTFVTVGSGTVSQYNWYGAYINDGDLKIQVATAPATHLDNNTYGIFAGGAALLAIAGADDGAGGKLVTADYNARTGIRFASTLAGDTQIPINSIDNAQMNNNLGAIGTYAGLYLYAGASMVVTNCNVLNNIGAGIRVQQNGTGTMANINLGDGP
ncbi:MAG TPA: hypothetical protein VGI10_04565, partial [Polyangiaceae bacterium]